MANLFPLPEEIPRWDKAPEGGMSYNDLWDMMKERGQPISKGLMVTGYEHISLMPLYEAGLWDAESTITRRHSGERDAK